MSGMGHDNMTGAAARSIRIARIGQWSVRPGCDVRDDLGRFQGLPCHAGARVRPRWRSSIAI